MKFRILFFFVIIPFLGFAQHTELNLKQIEKNISNPKSGYGYEKLIFKFKGYPKSLDSIEAQHLYYGRNFIENKVSVADEKFVKLADAFKTGNFQECIQIGKVLYGEDPTNLDVILILLRAYDSLKDGSNFVHHLNQLRLLTEAIKDSGDGKSEKTAFVVNSVGDEYILLNVLNIGQDFKRSSVTYKDSVVDVWSKDDLKVHIKVLYLDF
ncbi:DUF4919 domain-containing protein [Chryseobacterium echinoideorum]|uniref:DUF4919 domain-containing protein n=1 Tax=Chryseobacterium echinoideorum TaxID=1549648 RepID=UPI00118680CA|nr:DUF4919 domain-containing protein [Chryseobacterium echinoideorum]